MLINTCCCCTNKPNIILIIADDVNWDDIDCYGNTAIRTPNLNRLAKEGMKFTNAFVTSSSCSPSRSSILTGRYPHNTGSAELHTPLSAHLTFFSRLFQQEGYYTAQASKHHEGENTKRAYDTLIDQLITERAVRRASWLLTKISKVRAGLVSDIL